MALGTEPQQQGRMLDYEQFVDHQLHLTRSRIRATEVFTALVVMITGILGLLLLEIVLDHWIGLPWSVRAVILFGALLGGGYAFVRYVVRPLLSSVNSFYAACTIEAYDARFKNSLLNYIDLRRHRAELPPAVLRTLEARAVRDLADVQVEAAVDQRYLTKSFYALAAVVVLFCLYVVLTPKNVLDSARRALLADVARPTNTRLINIKPGDDEELSRVVSGSNVTFEAEVDYRGIRPDEVRLHYSSDGGEYFASTSLDEGEQRYDPWSVTLRNVQQDLIYYLSANDFETKQYRLTVLPAPRVVSVVHDLDFPDYTSVPDREGVEGGNIRALEGTMVTVRATTNQPARNGNLDLGALGTSRLVVSRDNPQELTGRFKVEENGSYSIKFETTEGQLNPEPVVYDIEALPDRVPEVRFIQPEPERIEVPSNSRIALALTASDDFGLSSATLHLEREGAAILDPQDLLEGKEASRSLDHVEALDLEAIGARAGDRLTYWAEVRDNRSPTAQEVQTSRRVLEIIDPIEEPESPNPNEQQTPPEDQPPRDGSGQQEPPPQDPTPPRDAPEEPAGEQPESPQGTPPPDQQPSQNGQGQGQQGGGSSGTEGQTPSDPSQPKNSDGTPRNEQSRPDDRPLSPEEQEKLDRMLNALDQDRQEPPPNQGDQRQGEGQQGDQRQGEGQQGDQRQGEGQQRQGEGQQRQGEGQQGDQRQGEGQQGDQRQGEGQQGDQRQGEGQQGDQRQGEGQQRQGEGQQGDQRQGEGQQRQGEGQQGDQRQGEGQQRQGEGQQGDQRQGEGQQGDQRQGEGQQGEPNQPGSQPGESMGDPQGEVGQAKLPPRLPEAKDLSEPPPTPDGPPEVGREAPIPESIDARDQKLRRIREALQDEDQTRKLEDLTGMTREEMSQFVERFSGPPEGPAGEGRELEVDLESQSGTIDPNRVVPDPLSGVRQSDGARRSQGTGVNDNLGMSRQGGGTPPPPQLRKLVEAYQRRLSDTNPPASEGRGNPAPGRSGGNP
ncbi:DUF4175 family protein [Tautonia rosea]|uniref:DUF4175 family protein n=1 Tax=Tautonia rosea TaxID=2728037 RepID=UPI001475C768|nr:DUF4175 family protein [Tautonia rosea]